MSNECQNPNIKDVISCRLNFELWHLTFMLNIQGIGCIDSQKDNDYDRGRWLVLIKEVKMIFLPRGGTDKEEKGKEEKIVVPNELPVLPLRGTVLYPDLILPIMVGRKKSVKLIDDAMDGDRIIGIITQKRSQKDPYFKVRCDTLEENFLPGVEIDALVMNLKNLFQRAVELAPYLTAELGTMVNNIKSPAILSDLIASNLN